MAQQTELRYDIEFRVWRDEQPGDEPALHVSVALHPRRPEDRSSSVSVERLELSSGVTQWTPDRIELRELEGANMEIHASGEATIPGGAVVTGTARLDTDFGIITINLPRTDVSRMN